MRQPRLVTWMLLVGMALTNSDAVFGQTFPNKPIRMVTGNVGGGADFVARLIAQGISGPLGQPVIVDNRPAGPISGEIVAKAQPDGHTLLVGGSNFSIGTLLLQRAVYDPIKDFSPVTIVDSAPYALVVSPATPANSVKEFIALAKAKPGELNYASTATGGMLHLAAELFKSMAGIDVVRIPYKGAAPALTDLMGGRVHLMIPSATSAMPYLKSGKLKGLAVTTLQPSALAPGLPPVAASLPGFEAIGITGIYSPAKTPAAVVNQLNREIVRYIRTPEVKEKFFVAGSEVVGSSPAELATALKTEMAVWGKVVKDGNIRGD